MAAISPWEESGAKKTIRISRAIVTIERDADGFYRPASEEALIALVKKAYAEGKQLRVRGSAHSVAAAIYADPLVTGDGEAGPASAPASDAIHVLLNNYRGLRVVDAGQRLVEVEAGVNLGVDPEDPSRTSTLDNSLLFNLWRLGWTLSDLGGITHQTVSGFFSTGSSGGSLRWSVYDDIQSLRMIDGRGEVYEVDRDRTPEDFQATVTSMGLLGIISKVVLRCVPTFNITGQEAITRVEDASVDLFGEGSAERPSLARFLEHTEYARLEWFPQRKGSGSPSGRPSASSRSRASGPCVIRSSAATPSCPRSSSACSSPCWAIWMISGRPAPSWSPSSSRWTRSSSNASRAWAGWASPWSRPSPWRWRGPWTRPSRCSRSRLRSCARNCRTSWAWRSTRSCRWTRARRARTRASPSASAIGAGGACPWTTRSSARCCPPRSRSCGFPCRTPSGP
ncbi:hypothetical protein ACN28S_58495 [Cystobacter fuscus]